MTSTARGSDPLRGLLVAQFFGAFNDNAWKMIFTLLAIDRVTVLAGTAAQAEAAAQGQTSLSMVALTVPLILFSLPAGVIADRVSKRSLIVTMKAFEVGLMAAGTWALAVQPQGGTAALVVLALMGAQSALFSPAKYGILPELLPHSRLSQGNARLELWSMLAIIGGTGAAGVLLAVAGERGWMAGAVLLLFALCGLVAARTVPSVPAARQDGGASEALPEAWKAIVADRILWLTVVGSVFFWVVASVLFQVLLVYAKTSLGLPNDRAGLVLGVLMAGIGAGAILAGRISGAKVEFGLLPLGAMLLAALVLTLGLLGPGFYGTLVIATLIGLAGGLINVPLNALKQWRAPATSRGAVLALSNLFIYSGMLAGSLAAAGLSGAGVSSRALILITGLAVVGGTGWALALMPAAFVRLVLVLLTHTFYRLQVTGGEGIPERGGALLVPNHVSFIDALLLLASTDRPIRFLVDVSYYNHPALKPFMKSMGTIPISSAGGPKLILRALRQAGQAVEDGEIVCIFPEGQITRIGMLLPFQRGFERIVKGRDVPIVPIFLDRVWGSIFSRSGGRFFTKVPRQIPFPVTIAVGRPLAPGTPIHEVRRRVRELGTEAWMARVDESRPLHYAVVRTFRRWPLRFAFADRNRPHLSRIKALAGAVALARSLAGPWQGQERVGILMPSTVAGALVNIAASLAGKVVVNLNFTAGRAGMESAARQAGLRTVVTSRQFIEKAGLELPGGVEPIWLEDVGATIGPGTRLLALALALLAPVRALEGACGATRPVRADDVATIIFSSGSTGEPKGIVLTHFNIDSNLRACVQVMPIRRDDRVLGILPFFHSFGYMATLWMPASLGVPIVYHPTPLDAMAIGDLVRQYRVTMMFATPTFLQLYIRRIAPGQFGSLRLVIAGAEKLPERVSQAFRDHFGFAPLEGYGVTETSPVIAVNVPDFRAPGLYQPGWRRGTVGQPIPGVAVRIVDPETHAPMGPGEEGMIITRGPNVMQGYLDRDDLTDEVMRDGWYVTGDIGKLDDDGFLTITDRYSRFSKIGGEMVPHGVVEEALERVSGIEERAFAVTAVEDPRKGERLAVVHTLYTDLIPAVLERLAGEGLPNLFVPKKDAFVHVDEIPLLGSGKTDLKGVREIARAALSDTDESP